MRKTLLVTFASLLFVTTLCLCAPSKALANDTIRLETPLEADNASESLIPNAEYVYQNEESGYFIYIDDWADILTASEEKQLLESMKPITTYGNVAFVSISSNPTHSAKRYAAEYYEERFYYSSGTILLIDLDERYIQIHSDGSIRKTITSSYSNTITDNVYAYASDGDYLLCASTAFEQINTLLEGRGIAQPMKYISNALLAIVLALLINYFLVMTLSRSRKATNSQLLDGIFSKTEIKNPQINLVNQTKRYSPQTRSTGAVSSSGRSGGGFSGGSRGGGSSGGHRF